MRTGEDGEDRLGQVRNGEEWLGMVRTWKL